VTFQVEVFWVVTPCSVLGYQRFILYTFLYDKIITPKAKYRMHLFGNSYLI